MNHYRPLRTRARKMYLVTMIILHMSYIQGLIRKKQQITSNMLLQAPEHSTLTGTN